MFKTEDVIKFGRAVLFVVAATVTFALAVRSLFMDRPAAAAVAGALSLAFVLLLQLPKLESFEVLTLKVRLRQQLSDAEKLLEHLRENASVTSKLMYIQLAFMNRLGEIPWSRKRVLLAEIDSHLSKLEVGSDQIREYKRPFLNIISFDLSRVLHGAMNVILRKHGSEIESQLSAYQKKGPIPADDTEFARLIALRNSYEQRREKYADITHEPRFADLKTLTSDWLANAPLEQEELAKLKTIQDEIVALSNACWAEGSITPETEEYLGKYGARVDTRLNELGGA